MIQNPRRILFDECIGRPHVQSLASLVAISDEACAEIKHVLDFQQMGIWDETWIPRIKNEGWIVITQDKSRRNTKGQPLSRVCIANNVTHVMLSRRIAERRSFDKMMTVLNLWYQILALADQPSGARYVIEPVSSAEEDRGRGKLIKRLAPQGKPRDFLFDKHSPPPDDPTPSTQS